MMPAEGEAFFTSAINPTLVACCVLREAARSAPKKSRCSPRSSMASRNSPAAIIRAGSLATSAFFCSTISSRMFISFSDSTASTQLMKSGNAYIDRSNPGGIFQK
jgi:hypothetical protein